MSKIIEIKNVENNMLTTELGKLNKNVYYFESSRSFYDTLTEPLYRECYKFFNQKSVDIEEIVVTTHRDENPIINAVRLMDEGFELLHPNVLLSMAQENLIPRNWEDFCVYFDGAWFSLLKSDGLSCDPLIQCVSWGTATPIKKAGWCFGGSDIKEKRQSHHVSAVIRKR